MESNQAVDSKKLDKPVRKRAPHKLTVDDSKDDENSVDKDFSLSHYWLDVKDEILNL